VGISAYLKQIRDQLGGQLLLLPGVCGIVFNDAGEILLHRRSDNGKWALMGGILDPDEQPADAVVREVWEETAVMVEPLRVTGVYLSPRVSYPNGDTAQYVITAFKCRPVSGTPRINDDESLEVRYFKLDELPALSKEHLLRIEHAKMEGPAFFAPASHRVS
jgi:8-oxo-dGTP pyrophosphatase MutT (NUDIX family)